MRRMEELRRVSPDEEAGNDVSRYDLLLRWRGRGKERKKERKRERERERERENSP
jgi:hypothetical protein